jgi:hypothetical protein
MTTQPTHNPIVTLSGFLRVAYSELVTVVVVSLLTTVSAISIVGFGGGLVAAVTTLRRVVTDRRDGIRIAERKRIVVYREVFFETVVRALPLGLVVWGAVITFIWYGFAAGESSNPWFLLAAAASIYVLTAIVIVTLRTATLLSLDASVSVVTAFHDSIHHLLDTPSFTVLHATVLVAVVALCFALVIAVPILLFGLLALLEVLVYTERDGGGARSVVLAYQRGDVA